MKYMSIDLETTGLNPRVHGITEFAAVFADDSKPDEKPQIFYKWINPEGYVWSTYCLQLHAKWIARVCERIGKREMVETKQEPSIMGNVKELGQVFMTWWSAVDSGSHHEFMTKQRGNITGAGKNFGTFDLQFLKAWDFPDVFRHRVLEWLPTYQLPEDKIPPDLKLCKERAILMGCPELTAEVAHNALEDAMDVHKLIQYAAKHRRLPS